MTNHEKWQHLTKDLEAPQRFLDFAFYFAISAALERRVFFGDPARALYCNQYIMLVGPPGLGKGVSMREANHLLKKHDFRLPDNSPIIDRNTKQPRKLFYQLPSAVTFEKLAFDFADATVPYLRADGSIYAHASGYFLLEELSSLFRKNKSEDVARFLLNLYDNEPFDYKTRHHGTAEIKNGCLNLLTGFTHDFLRSAEENGLLGEGLFSRSLLVVEERPRQIKFHYSDLTADQLQCQTDLQNHLKSLSRIYGRIKESAETHEWLEEWWAEEFEHLLAFGDDKLMKFFSRRKVQMMKLAAAIHFSETAEEFEIPLAIYQQAAALIRDAEPGVIKISRRTGRNPQYSIQERILSWLKVKPRQYHEVVKRFAHEVDINQLNVIMQGLIMGNQVINDGPFLSVVRNNQQQENEETTSTDSASGLSV